MPKRNPHRLLSKTLGVLFSKPYNNTKHNNTEAGFWVGSLTQPKPKTLHVLVRLTIKQVSLSLLLSLQSFTFATQLRAFQSL